jgi:hypothetical protein
MYLILPKAEAINRNSFEAFKRGCNPPTTQWWSFSDLNDGRIALNVLDGDGLSKHELEECVLEIEIINEP